jgi:hypothetical protein
MLGGDYVPMLTGALDDSRKRYSRKLVVYLLNNFLPKMNGSKLSNCFKVLAIFDYFQYVGKGREGGFKNAIT